MQQGPAPTTPGRRLPRRTQLAILGAAGLVATFLLFGAPLLVHAFAAKPPAEPGPAPAGAFVATDAQWASLKFATVQTASFRSEVQTEGKIATDDDQTTQIFSPYSGLVTRVLAKAGDHVRAGQPLFVVQASEFAQGQSDLASAVAQAKLTRAAAERQRELFKVSGAALKDLQQSEADFAAATANLEMVRNRLRILGRSDAEIARLEQGSNTKSAAQSVVASPINGVVTVRSVGVGQNIGSVTNGGSNPAFVVSNVSTIWLVGQVRETDAPKARVGETVEVHVAALPERMFTAKVDYVAATVDPLTHRVAVRAAIANPGGLLKPEMFASFTLITDGVSQAPAVPEAAVIYEADTARVWIAHPGRRLELRQITAGRSSGGMVEVLAGLTAGEQVVTSGSLFIDRAAQSN